MIVNFGLFLIVALMRIVQFVSRKKSSDLVNDLRTFVGYGCFYMVSATIIAFIPLFINGFNDLNLQTILIGTFIGILFDISFFVGLIVLKKCSMVVVSMFELGGLIVSCFINWIWLNEAMSIVQIIFLFIFIFGIYILISNKENANQAQNKITLSSFIMLLSLLLVEGFTMVAQKFFVLKVENGNIYALQFFQFFINVIVLGIAYILISINQKDKPLFKKLPKTLYLTGLGMGLSLFFIALIITFVSKTVPSIIVFPISCCISCVITCLISALIFKEKLTKRKIIGIVIALFAIVCICIFTNDTLNNLLMNY